MADEKEAIISRVTRSKAEARFTYDRLSRWYDLLSGASEQAANRDGMGMLQLEAGETVLEVGFGTGHNLLELAKAVGESGKVYGIDLSEGMRSVAEARVQRAGFANWVVLECGDALHLPYENAKFDAVFSAFTLELFDTPEIPLVLQECRRVLRPQGQIGIVSLSKYGKPNTMTRLYEWSHLKFPNFVDCRPILVQPSLAAAGFDVQVKHRSMWGLPMEIAVGIKAG